MNTINSETVTLSLIITVRCTVLLIEKFYSPNIFNASFIQSANSAK